MIDAPLTPAVFHVLLALADGPLHGYAIMQAVERTAGPGLSTGPGTIYGTIQRLEDGGLVREVAAPKTGRRRQVRADAVWPTRARDRGDAAHAPGAAGAKPAHRAH